jgi:peptidoglycan/LPS O-acetylase OafA/YrhL
LGSYSYSAYLWHGPLVVLVITPLRSAYSECWRDWMEVIFSFTCTWVVGMIAAKLVELPALRLRDRLVPVQLPQLAEKQGSKNTGF